MKRKTRLIPPSMLKDYRPEHCSLWDAKRGIGVAMDPYRRDDPDRLYYRDGKRTPLPKKEAERYLSRLAEFSGRLTFRRTANSKIIVSWENKGLPPPERIVLQKKMLWAPTPEHWPPAVRAEFPWGSPVPIFQAVQSLQSNLGSDEDWKQVNEVLRRAILDPNGVTDNPDDADDCGCSNFERLAMLVRCIEVLRSYEKPPSTREPGSLRGEWLQVERAMGALASVAEDVGGVPTVAEVRKRLIDNGVQVDSSRMNELLCQIGFAWLPDDNDAKGRRGDVWGDVGSLPSR